MEDKRIFLIEDILQKQFMEDLFKRHSNKGQYELVTALDLSDEGIYKRHLPEGYDIYWLHSSSTEFDAIDEIKNKQPWSKIVVRTAVKEVEAVNSYLRRNRIDRTISNLDGLNQEVILKVLASVGINILLPRGEE